MSIHSDSESGPDGNVPSGMIVRLGLSLALLASCVSAQAAKVIQATGATHVAFEAESTSLLIPGTPENWVVKTDPNASGGAVLIADGTNSTGDSPHSFAQYDLNFATPGTYFLYYRWRSDAARTGGDAFTANSTWIGNRFGAFSTPGSAAQADYVRSDSNNTQAPANNTFEWRREVETFTYTVGAPGRQILTLGTREAGMIFDRIVLSSDPALTPAALDALANSETDVVIQGNGETFLAWEAETKGNLIAGTPENWFAKSDTAASGGGAIVADGTNSTGDSPHSFAQFNLKFGTPGTYYLYYRWRADAARTGGDAFTANSSWIGNRFGAFSTTGAAAQADYVRSDSNNTQAPANNSYDWRREVESLTYTVGAAELAAIQTLTIGTREAGMFFDRFVLSTDPALTAASLDALVNSGTKPPTPEVKLAVGSATLNRVTITFTRPLGASTVRAQNFAIAGLAVTAATLDADDARIVQLTTASQTEGTPYVVNIANVRDTAGTLVAANTQARFTAWKRVAGWATRESWLSTPGTSLADIANNPRYPDRPDRVQFVRGFQVPRSGALLDLIVRLSAWYTPPASGAWELLVNNDDEAEIFLSTNAGEANLTSLGQLLLHAPPFADGIGVVTPDLVSGTRYLLRGVLKQGGGDAFLDVGARPAGTGVPDAESLPILGGSAISTMVNPDLGVVQFEGQPQDATSNVGARARFAVKAQALTSPVYYQWRRNGSPIPGATRPVYTTPVLATGDNNATIDVQVAVAGITNVSRAATLRVNPGEPGPLRPFLGVNFTGGGYASEDSVSLSAVDVAGVVAQENWNNLGATLGPVTLTDASGQASPVSLTISTPGGATPGQWSSGSRVLGDADSDLMQGFIQFGTGPEPVSFTLEGVPAGTYNLIAYTLGFDFQADYQETFSVVGAGNHPTYQAIGEPGLDYVQNPGFRRITSTNPNARQRGNYVQFDAVSPTAGGSLTLVVQWVGTTGSYNPAVNGFQLVRVVPATVKPTLTITAAGTSATLSWDSAASGFRLESNDNLGNAGGWTPVSGVAQPLTGSGTLSLTPSAAGRYYRLILR